MKRPLNTLLALAAALAAGAAQAQAFKCADAAGKLVYSERPCESQGLRTQGTVKAPPPRPVDPMPHQTKAGKPAAPAPKGQPAGGTPGQADDGVPRDKRGNPAT